MKKLIFLLIGLFTATYLLAGVVTEEEALQKAERFLQGKKVLARAKASRARGKQSDAGADFGKAFYVFNVENKGGFVIVSGDDRTEEILGYSEIGEMDLDNLPSNVKAWLEGYQQQINALGNSEVTNVSKKSRAAIPYLIKTTWNQGSPYDQQCPVVEEDGYSYNCLTGCVATAMAQVLYYYKLPKNETGDLEGYTTSTLGLNVDALPSTEFNWQNMSLSYGSDEWYEAQEVSKLMRYCGQLVKMDYTKGGSAANFLYIGSNLEGWGYLKSSLKFHSQYQTEEWEDLIYGELSARRPVIYSGPSTLGFAHAFVCDGYDGNGLFHMNWGWGGKYDGYFRLSALDPAMHDYSSYQKAIINLQPSDGVIPSNLDGTEFTAMTKEGIEMNFMITYDDGTIRNCEVSRHRNDGTYDRCIEEYYEGSLSIPSEVYYDGHTYQVTGIGSSAFSYCSLTSISIPASVNFIFHNAFSGCANLNSLTIDSGNTKYYDGGGNAVIEKNTDRLIVGTNTTVIPESVKEIGNEAFAGSKIKSLVIPKGVKYIGELAFSECTELSSLSVHPENSIYDSRNGCNAIIETASNKLLLATCNTIIPSDVTWIGEYAFSELPNLAITIPTTVKRIDNYVFLNCSDGVLTVCYEDLSSVSISSYAFSGAGWYDMILRVPSGMKKAYLQTDGWNLFKEKNVYEGNGGTEFTTVVSGVNMTFTIIEDNERKAVKVGCLKGDRDSRAIDKTITVSSLTIPETVTYNDETYSVTTIGAYAFNGSYNLEHVFLPSSIEYIKEYAFYYCNNVTLDLPEKLKEIGAYAFRYCYKLADVMIPKSLVAIGECAFSNTNLTSLKVAEGNEKYSSRNGCNAVIENSTNKLILGIKNSIIPADVTAIGDYAFCGVRGVQLEIPSSVESIGDYAFSECSSCGLIVQWETPLVINEYAFGNGSMDNDSYLRVPKNTKTAYLAAKGWNKFKPENVVEGYTGVEFTVALENGVEMWFTITEDDEDNKTAKVGRRNGNYPSSAVTALNDDRTVIIPSKVTYKGTEYTVNTIGAYAFYEIGSLNFISSSQLQIEIPATITTIEGYAFAYCSKLSIIAESETPATAEESSFSVGYKLRVPAGSKDSYLAATGWNIFNAGDVIDGYVDVELTVMLEDNVEMWFTITKDDANNKTAKVGKLKPGNKNRAIDTSIDNKIITIPQIIKYRNTTYTVNEIGDFSFYCARQEQIKLPSTITSIGDYAFANLDKLTITLPKNISYLGYCAFYCQNLDMTVMNEIPATINKDAFSYIQYTKSHILRVPKGSKQAYLSANGWNSFPENDVIEYVSGDVNGDGEVDIADAVCIVNHIVGKATPVFVEAAADVNNDGAVDIADAVRVVNLIVGKTNTLARQKFSSLPEPE